MKRVLFVASVASMIGRFNIPSIKILRDLGYEVDVACNFKDYGLYSEKELKELKDSLKKLNVNFFQIDFTRSIFNFGSHVRAYKQVKKLTKENHYDFIHCHTPIGGVVGRLIGYNFKIPVVYTAHGFHFFKGGPLLSWILFFPIEKLLSYITYMIITINKEDYILAKNKLNSKETKYIPGVGFSLNRFQNIKISKSEKRMELGIPQDSFCLLSVGELAARKNHQVVIKALGEIKDPSIYYIIAGIGDDYIYYKSLINDNNLVKNVFLLGERTDIEELCQAADVFVHPSIREGLGIAPLEAMATGLPLISSYVNGIKDYTEDNYTGICIKNPKSIEEMKNAIVRMKTDEGLRISAGQNNRKIAQKFSLSNSNTEIKKIYSFISEKLQK